jgi:integrase
MASLYQDPASGIFRVMFRFGKASKQFHKSLDTTDRRAAEAEKGRIESTLQAIEQGWLALPPHADFWQFVRSGGKLEEKPSARDVLTLANLFTRYDEQLPPGAMEDNSLSTHRLHRKHVLRILGDKQPAQALTTADLQGYINRRAKETYRGKPIKSRTIKKEVATFRAVWNWGVLHGLLTGHAPVRGLKYEKGDEPLPFMTWAEIEQRVARGGLTQDEVGDLWDCLWLDTEQIDELLAYVKEHAELPFIYPMFVFIARTSARRSEMLNSRVEDIDLQAGEVVLREKKRNRKVKVTFRRVPMTPMLAEVMQAWLRHGHPGGPYTFCHQDVVARSRKRSKTTGHKGEKTRETTLKGRLAAVHERRERRGPEALTPDEATDHFKQTLAGSKWQVVRGFHVFRHSFASNLASAGVDQRLIDKWMGHQTEEMRRRYQHLHPKLGQEALSRVYR